jgi:transcriptional regulator with XRE-family HTH domain
MTLDDFLIQAYPDVSWIQREQEFAGKIGVARQSINRYRRFVRFPSPAMIARIREESGNLVRADDHLPPQYRESAAELRRSA